jgi:hypothetical protein
MMRNLTAALRMLVEPLDDISWVYLAPPLAADPHPISEAALRWRMAGDRLAALGADESTLDAMWLPVRSAAATRTPVAVFGRGGLVVLAQQMPGAAVRDAAGFGAPPPLLPLLAWAQADRPYVVVVADHAGADITGYSSRRRVGATTRVQGPGDDLAGHPLRGWQEIRFHRRAEDSWRANATASAAAAIQVADAVDADQIIVVGDRRSTHLVGKELDVLNHRLTIQRLPRGRHPDGSTAARPRRVERLVQGAANQETATLVARFQDALGPTGHAVQGGTATVAALAKSRVDTLLVNEAFDDTRLAYFGGPGSVLGLDGRAEDPNVAGERLTAAGPVRCGPLVDAAVRSALLEGARVHVLPAGIQGGPEEGIGALCRYRLDGQSAGLRMTLDPG